MDARRTNHIPCEAIEEDVVLAVPKALLAVSVIPCDEKARNIQKLEAVALQEVRLKRYGFVLTAEARE